MSEKSKKFKSHVEEVEYLLSRYPEARNNDLFLQWVWLKEIIGLNIPDLAWQKFQLYAGKLGSLRRIRQKIQATGRFLPSDKRVLEKRTRLRMMRLRSPTRDFTVFA